MQSLIPLPRWFSLRSIRQWLGISFGLGLVAIHSPLYGTEANEGVEFFEKHVRPLLVDQCYGCHSQQAGEANGELLLDSRPAMLRGGTRGKVLDQTRPEESLLLKAVEHRDPELKMPPDSRLPDAQISILKKWVEMGAPDPREEEGKGKSLGSMAQRLDAAASHWAYQPLQPPRDSLPVADGSPVDPIDSMVRVKLTEQGLEPARPADRRTLVRRLYYDLIGLPPTFEDLNRWTESREDDWYERLVDGLLESPHFGERMARRWMDVVRYADNKGYVFREDREYAHAFRYRDWLIRSFNQDLPYRDFVRFQLIADRLDPENKQGHLDAMGMLTLGRRFLQNQQDIIDDRIDVVSRGLLGVTATCARCHDHKFDPVEASDYYSLYAAFKDSDEPGGEPSPLRLVDKPNRSSTRVFVRGNPANQGEEFERRFFPFLVQGEPRLMKTGSGRLELAEAIADPLNPLTARVYVNRVWGWIFGRPLVDTPSDFGLRCEPPTHQGVLDRLAWDWMQEGWSTKRLIRRMVMTTTYRQSSQIHPSAFEIDPDNRWLGRANRKRMEFEPYRDAMLKMTGNLDEAIGGKSEVIHALPFSKRRTLYAYIDRQNLPQLFRLFDFASPDAHVPFRPQTTVPQQGLVLMNSDFVLELSRSFAHSAATESEIRQLFLQLLARQPNPAEIERSLAFLAAWKAELPLVATNRWTYGYGRIDIDKGKLDSFYPFTEFDGERWRGTGGYPDAVIGWSMLDRQGGHPGHSHDFAVIRRWTAPRAGTVRIDGVLEHTAEQGNGVRASLFQGGQKLHRTWSVHKKKVETDVSTITVDAADELDFVVDALDDVAYDAFQWKVELRYEGTSASFDSADHFSGYQPRTASAMEALAQALMLTNEFCFVD